jgi:hypothetical protein
MRKTSLRHCICCNTNYVKDSRRSDSKYCKSCGKFLARYYNVIYARVWKNIGYRIVDNVKMMFDRSIKVKFKKRF